MYKTLVSVSTNIKINVNNISRAFSSGYLHNPGSEPLTHATFGQVVEATAHSHPGRAAVRSVYQDLTVTYEQLLTKADALGCSLRAQGLEKGDMVGIWSHNNAEWIVTLVAAARAGLISVLLNPVYEKRELSFCIKKTDLKAIVIGDTIDKRNYYKLIEELIPEVHKNKAGSIESKYFPSLKSIITCDKEALPGTFTLESLVANKGAARPGAEVCPGDGAVIHLTSGTTGDPKAALDSHFGYVNNSYFIGKRQNLHDGHHKICVQAPLFHAMGSVVTTGAALRHGASLVLAAPTYNVDMNLNALLGEECTILNGTPTMFVDLIALLRRRGGAPRLRGALSGGAPCSPQLIRDIKHHLNADTVSSLFGLSETTAAVFQSLPEDSTELVADTVGYIHDHVEAKVVDDEGNMVPFGTSGELMVRGYCNMMGYWGDPRKTRETLREDGWLYTGDKFTLSEDGYGRIVGRLKDIIVRGGENVAPKEVEDLLNTHPDIVESQVSPWDGYGRIVGRLKDIIVRGGENVAPKEVEDLLNTHPDIVESQVSPWDGYGRIVGRLKDIIVRGGENVAPKEVEDLLNTHPDIVESQVSPWDGYGRIVGRLKDIIVRGGENVAPKEVEDLLNTHPDIVESQVSPWDGYGRIVGRLKDIIVRGGENVAPKEVEDLLNTHPDIVESQVSPWDGYGRVVGRLKDIIVRGGENVAPKEVEDLLNTHPDIVESQVSPWDGYGRIVGRLKDIIVRGGENVAPKEVEDLLNTHPDIVESQVVGVSDERLGEELCAVVRLREGATMTPDDLRRHCSGHVAKFKIPRMLRIADDFPKTNSGKIQKFKIREMIESGKL